LQYRKRIVLNDPEDIEPGGFEIPEHDDSRPIRKKKKKKKGRRRKKEKHFFLLFYKYIFGDNNNRNNSIFAVKRSFYH